MVFNAKFVVNKYHLVFVFCLIVVSRLWGAIVIPNSEYDCFSHTEMINELRTVIAEGRFRVGSLYGFWMPLYRALCALIELPFSNLSLPASLLIPKLVSSFFGILLCFLIMWITIRITQKEWCGLLAGIACLFNPTLFFASVTALTDVPYAAFVMGMILAASYGRWIAASWLLAAASFTRTDGWVLIPLIACVILLRKIPWRTNITCLLIMVSPILLWFWISQDATGNPFCWFSGRIQFCKELILFAPEVYRPTMRQFLHNFSWLLVGPSIFLATIALSMFVNFIRGRSNAFSLGQVLREQNGRDCCKGLLALMTGYLLFYFLLAYGARQQTVFFPRHGIMVLCLVIPLATLCLSRMTVPRVLTRWIILVLLILGVRNYAIQAQLEFRARSFADKVDAVTEYVKRYGLASAQKKIYCDLSRIRLMSGLSRDRFVEFFDSGFEAARKMVQNIDEPIRGKNVGLCIVWRKDDPLLRQRPELLEKKDLGIYQYIPILSDSDLRYCGFYVYQVSPEEVFH